MVKTTDRRPEYETRSRVYDTLVTIAQRKGLKFSEWHKPQGFTLEGKAIEVRLPNEENTNGYEVISRNKKDDAFGYELAASYERATNIPFTFIKDGPRHRIEQREDNGRVPTRQTQKDVSNRVQ